MKKLRIYISAPITGRDLEERKAYFEDVAGQLKKMGALAVNPMNNTLDDGATHEEHMREDIRLLLRCDGYVQAYDSCGSNGCDLEEAVAQDCGIRYCGIIGMDGKVRLSFWGKKNLKKKEK